MARRKPKDRTQPEHERARKQLLLRLEPATIARLRAIAEQREATVSGVVEELVASASLSVGDD